MSFIVRSMQYWEGVTSLDLERNVMACGEKLNQFFASTIEENKTQLALDSRDRFVIQESKLLSSCLTHVMPNLSFFLGIDKEKKRCLQAITNTEVNQAAAYTELWQALNALAIDMSERLHVA